MSERAVGRVRFERAKKRDGAPHAFGFGVRCVCDHCGAEIPITHAEITLDMEDYPRAVLTVAAPIVDDVLAFIMEGGVKPADPQTAAAHTVHLYDSAGQPFPTHAVALRCRVPSHAADCQCAEVVA